MAGDAARRRGLGHGGGDAQHQARIERRGDQAGLAEGGGDAGGAGHLVGGRLLGQRRDGLDGGELHRLVDRGGADIERAPENIGEAQDIVDLVGIIRAPRAQHGVGAHRQGLFRQDFRMRIGERQDQRRRRHFRHHVGLEHAAGGQAQKHVGIGNDFGQGAGGGVLGKRFLQRVHQRVAALENHAVEVGDPNVFAPGAERNQQAQAGEGRRAGAGRDDLRLLDAFSGEFQAVGHGGADDDGGAVLVVVEHRDRQFFTQAALDLKTFRAP